MLASKWTFGAAVVAALTMMACSSSGSPEASKGKDLFTKYQCSVCHNTTGAAGGTGPTLKGLFGKQVKLDGGQTVTADDAYIKESILQPDAKIVEGYSKGTMAAVVSQYESDIQQDGNLDALVAYIKSLS